MHFYLKTYCYCEELEGCPTIALNLTLYWNESQPAVSSMTAGWSLKQIAQLILNVIPAFLFFTLSKAEQLKVLNERIKSTERHHSFYVF